jgi:hypothetical protein
MTDAPLHQSGIDPYIFWLLGEGKQYYFLPGRQQEWIPLFLLLSDEFTAQEFADGAHITATERRVAWQRAVRVPSLYTDSTIVAGKGSYITAFMSASYLLKDFVEDEGLRADLRRAVRTVTPGLPLDTPPPTTERRQKAAVATAEAPTAPSNTVVMGIIDDGIAFAHERFRKIVGGKIESRVENWWLQDGPPSPATPPFTDPTPPPPPPVPFGCELTRSQITGLLQNSVIAGDVDEDLVYRKARLIDFQKPGHKSAAWRIAHGTHVMDLACGFDPDPPRNDRPIICVQLPIRVTADTAGASLFPHVFVAMWYILVRASQIPGAANAPVVINLSYGRLEGPHDGTADLELAIEFLVAISGGRLRVVLPAGNSYLSRTHAQVTFASDNEAEELRWRVLPDDQTPSFVEVWLPKRDFGTFASRLDVTITSPTGESHTLPEFGGPVKWGAAPFYAEAHFYFSLVTGRTMFRLSARPTADLTPGAPLAPAGIWKIKLTNIALTGQTVHAWVQRDDSLYGLPLRGRQSYFDDPDYERDRLDHAGRDNEFDNNVSLARRESTISSIATGAAPTVMGAYLGKEKVLAKYSSAGSRTAAPPRKPNAAAVGEDSRVHHGVLAAGSHSGSVVAMGGTSVAAPQAARSIADQLAGGGPPVLIALPQPERSGAGGIVTDPIVKLKRYEFP